MYTPGIYRYQKISISQFRPGTSFGPKISWLVTYPEITVSCYNHGRNCFLLVQNRHTPKGCDEQWMVRRNQHIVAAHHLVVTSKHECVTLVWPKRSPAKTISSFLMFRKTDWCSPIVGFISRSLLPMLIFRKVCHYSKTYLLIDGLKLENGIWKKVGSKESDVFACWSTISFPRIPIRLEIQQRIVSLFAKSSWHFL